MLLSPVEPPSVLLSPVLLSPVLSFPELLLSELSSPVLLSPVLSLSVEGKKCCIKESGIAEHALRVLAIMQTDNNAMIVFFMNKYLLWLVRIL